MKKTFKTKLLNGVAVAGTIAILASAALPAFASTATFNTPLPKFSWETDEATGVNNSGSNTFSIWLSSVGTGIYGSPENAYFWATDAWGNSISGATILPSLNNRTKTSTTLAYTNNHPRGQNVKLRAKGVDNRGSIISISGKVNFG